jgi:methionine--tRNA ligase beta chain
MISIDEFKKVDIRIGKILTVEVVPDTDKLLRLEVDFNEEAPRQVVSGIREFFEDPEVLVGKKCPFVTNLEPRTIRGLESQAMIFAASTDEGVFSILEPTGGDITPGTKLI